LPEELEGTSAAAAGPELLPFAPAVGQLRGCVVGAIKKGREPAAEWAGSQILEQIPIKRHRILRRRDSCGIRLL